METVVLNLFIWVAILIFGYFLDGEFLLVSYNSVPGRYLGGIPFLVLSAALVINSIILAAGALSGVLDKHLPTLRNLAWGMTVTVTIASVLYLKFVR